MGFLSSIIGAISGGSPWGAVADVGMSMLDKAAGGAVEGGLNKGFEGAVNSLWGRSPKPRSPAELGADAREFYTHAYPGTNPWEQLGTANPSSPVEVVREQTRQQKYSIDTSTRAQLESARISGRAAAAQAAAEFGPETVRELGDYIANGRDPKWSHAGPGVSVSPNAPGRSARQVSADAAALQARMAELRVMLDAGRASLTPAHAAVHAMSAMAFRAGLDRKDFRKFVEQSLTVGGKLVSGAEQLIASLMESFARVSGEKTSVPGAEGGGVDWDAVRGKALRSGVLERLLGLD